MKTRWMAVCGMIAAILEATHPVVARGQERKATTTVQQLVYELGREVTVIGKVQSYGANSPASPMGPHVTLQTSSAMLDVHLGDARLLQANHMTIETGDTLRIIGEVVGLGNGKQFVARIVQKGTQAIVVRTAKGFPLTPAAPITVERATPQGGVR